ncbi:unnamed protein product [Alternaria alternata]
MPKRSEEDESEWTIRKNDILDLYVEQDRSLSEVIRVMADQGFTRTKPQYERSLKRRRVSKNVRKEEWDFIFGRMNQRQRPTTVKVRGITIPQSRLERQKLRHRESTLALYEPKLNPLPHCQTPPNIEISTPPPSLPDYDSQLVTLPEHKYGGEPEEYDQETSVGEDIRDQNVLLSGEVPILSSIYDDASINTLLEMPEDNTANETSKKREISPSLSGLHSIGSPPILSGPLYDYIYRLFSGDSDHVLQDAIKMMSQYQVHKSQRSAEDTIYQSTDILVKAIVRYNAPSREFHQIIRRTQDNSDLDLLQRVLIATDSDGDWKTFGETLLFDAVKDGNLLLLDILLDAGVNEIAPGEEEDTEYPFNALQIAVQYRHDEVIRTLTR